MSIRLAQTKDLPQMLAIYGPYVENTAYSFEYTVPTLPEFTARFESYTKQFPWLVWEEDGQVLGYAYGSAPFERAAFGWCAEASVYLHPNAHRKGIGTKLYKALEALLKQQGYRKLYALVTSENRISLAFHEALGYRQIATFPDCGYKFGRLHSLVWLEKDLNSVENTKSTPTPFSSFGKNYQKLQDILANMSLS
ncbi:MAG: N-acetyltransferase [Oscillospiraceae bacterium]|nr:N-acetyltransferase [Oscillospiraceae bacterium]